MSSHSRLSALGSRLSALGSRARILTAAAALAASVSLPAQNFVWSTHDHTLSLGPPEEILFDETWADVKTPGGWPTTQVSYPTGFPPTTDRRRTYVVGTIEVNLTLGAPLFSGAPASTGTPALLPFGSILTSPFKRQVAMTQWNLARTNGIVRQRYFYGLTGSGPTEIFTRATNARGISVWETGVASTTRIAICGETYDERLPSSQASGAGGWALHSALHPSGFIAVYDGDGTLLWTHHFFDSLNPVAYDCAITDVSIRVDDSGDDVVTYCGISTHGSSAGGELAPIAPFLPVSTCSGGTPSAPGGQWDAFVGRVVSSGAGTSLRVFHSVVSGGGGQDLLMGIAEINDRQFAVAGSTQLDAGVSVFPFTSQCGVFSGPYVLGTVMVFDVTGVGPGGTGNLVLQHSEPIGFPLSGFHTVARDICVGRDMHVPLVPGVHDVLYVVGSTDNNFTPLPGSPDTLFSGSIAAFPVSPPPGQDEILGPTDGFLAALVIETSVPALVPWAYSYHGGPGNDGLTGVNGWSEFSEHVAVTGFTDDGEGAIDIDVGTYFFNNAVGPTHAGFTGPLNSSGQLLRVRRFTIGSTSEDRPAVMGRISASTDGHPILDFLLGQESGGGVAVGPDGRVNVAGRTTTPAVPPYPVVGATARGPDFLTDAVRTELDVLVRTSGAPFGIGTGRTDGTGFQGGLTGFFPPAPSSGLTGGTTPFCALSEFGVRNGVAPGATGSWLPRMLIDVEGDLVPNSTTAAILVSRPAVDTPPATVTIGGLQFNFPPTSPFAFITGTEYWLGGGSGYTSFVVLARNQAFRLPMPPLTPGLGPVSAQLTCLLSTPIPGPGGCSTQTPASPALWFTW